MVPLPRGRERSREISAFSLRSEPNRGFKRSNLLGQNVDSLLLCTRRWAFIVNFAQLLEKVALNSPNLVRFSTSHPKDITDEVLHTMAKYENI